MNTFLTFLVLLGGAVGLKTIKKDVVIIGGGSAGIYTGIQLMDAGKDIAIIERSDYIGSHANTYYDPLTMAPINVGVQNFHNVSVVRDYFARLNVSTPEGQTFPTYTTVNVDFTTGQEVKNYTSANYSSIVAGFQKFRNVLAEKYAYLDDGFNLPDPIPEELLLPFSEFAAKYGVEAILPSVVTFIEPVEIWKELSLYVIKNFGLESVENYLSILSGDVYHPKDTNAIYRSAAKVLGSRVLLNSTAQSVARKNGKVTVIAKTPSGLVCIEASKIVMAAPPFLQNFAGWDLSEDETQLFSKFRGKDVHIAITRNPEWNNVSYNGVGPDYTATTPKIPGTISVNPTGFSDSSYYSYIGFPNQVSVADALVVFKKELNSLMANGVMPKSDFGIVEWFNHNYYMNYVSEADIKAGFYTKVNKLQGSSNTFYVGAAWAGQDSSYIWRVAQALLPKILA